MCKQTNTSKQTQILNLHRQLGKRPDAREDDFEKPVKETNIPSRKHYENVLVVNFPSDS